MALPSRATLRTNARIRADQDNSDFPTDAAYNTYLDDAARETWWDLRVAGWPINFNSTFFTSTGATFYSLSAASPAVTVQVASVHGIYLRLGTEFYPLKRVNEGQRATLMSTTFQPQGFAGFYDLRIDPVTGPGVELLPPSPGGTYRVDYILEHPGFANDADTWYGPARSDSMVVLRAAEYAVKKEGPARASEAAAIHAEYQEMLAKVTNTASWFDMRNAASVRDVSSEATRFSFDYPLAGPDRW